MIDPSSFDTALTALGVITAMVFAFGVAALSDMAMRRREDRAARSDRTPSPDGSHPS
ncbi:hypothetical protein ACFW31_11170 [Nocardiopsis alba]|uniref:hypothetical protein n=1 Tax=Nocardiopsis alba TaxID=53437 RepID=UPI0019294245|nr:hypothetical protein [Nocardiopsis alba]